MCLLCVDIQKRQFLSSSCLMKDSVDIEHREIDSEDTLAPTTVQVSSIDDVNLISTAEV